MNKILLLLLFTFGASAFGAELNLGGGESATIRANVETQVYCGGSGGSDCSGPAQAFNASMEACDRSYSPGDCAKKLWPKYKESNPSCVYAGVETCLQYCDRSYSPGFCADLCM